MEVSVSREGEIDNCGECGGENCECVKVCNYVYNETRL